MLHIVFQEADVIILQKAIELDESLQGEIFEIKDDFAVGPIENIYGEEDYQKRRNWWKELLQYSPYTDSLRIVNDPLTVQTLIKRLSENNTDEAWIWVVQNQHDVCGYYWLISQLKNYIGRLQIIHLHNLPFINEKGNIFYPSALHEIQPKELLKSKRLARYITASEYEVDADEWKKICNENGMIRILEGAKKIVNKDVTYYDKDVLSVIENEPQKLQKILHTIYTKTKIKTGDVFLVWRIRELINDGILEAIGDWTKGWKEITIKLAGSELTENNNVQIQAD